MKYVLLILIAITAGCAQVPDGSIDPAFSGYFNQFMQDAKTFGRRTDTQSLTIRFGLSKVEVNGECQAVQKSGLGSLGQKVTWIEKTISINQANWESASEINRKTIIYHELGHCVLGIYKHNDNVQTFPDGNALPQSIMNTYDIAEMNATSTSYYWNSYVSQLFTGYFNFTLASTPITTVANEISIPKSSSYKNATGVVVTGIIVIE